MAAIRPQTANSQMAIAQRDYWRGVASDTKAAICMTPHIEPRNAPGKQDCCGGLARPSRRGGARDGLAQIL